MGRPRFVAGEVTSVPWTGLKGEIGHVYDGWGSHRLTHNGRLGDWVNWVEVATLKIGDRSFRAYTDFHADVNEIEEVIAVLPRTLCDLYRGEDE